MASSNDRSANGRQELQGRLLAGVAANTPESGVEHVLIALPSFSLGESLLHHYADRIPALEHRYLVSALMLPRIATCDLVFLTCSAPGPEVVEYYLSLVPSELRASARARLHVVEVPDSSSRAVAAKLLERPDLIDSIRAFIAGRLAFIEPWNVTDVEMAVARGLDVPIHGTTPDLWSLGYKSAGRKLFAEAGVPLPDGVEDLHSVDEVVAAIETIRLQRPDVSAVVIKHDDSGSGDGNVVVRLDTDVAQVVRTLPEWYRRDIAMGTVVEARVEGEQFASPSVQIDISPDGEVIVLATHDQVLGGNDAQIYLGCRFPGRSEYSTELARHGRVVGELLARRGARGRASLDFAAVADSDGSWSVFALEINLRKGGTTHPYAVLRNVVPGRYDPDQGAWIADDGSTRCYVATDNLLDPAWVGLPPSTVIRAVDEAGLRFDFETGTGVVLHMLSCLAIDGRMGLTAIGHTPEEAGELHEATGAAIRRFA